MSTPARPGPRTRAAAAAAAAAAAGPAPPQSPKRSVPLKRSSSTMSLPTPPRTQKRKRGRRSATPVSDSDASDDERSRAKKRKTTEERTLDEEAFWTARGLAPVAEEDEGAGAPGEEPPVLFRKLQRQGTTGMPPMSPPPSHRKVVKVRATVTQVTETVEVPRPTTPTPSTPKRRVATPSTPRARALPRDSPENPFLESPTTPTPASSRSSKQGSPKALRESPDLDERPTLTYVYRGTKRQLPNPNWDHVKNRPRSPDPRSLLDPSDPDFVPDLRCAPKILFPQVHKGKGKARATIGKAREATGKAPETLDKVPATVKARAPAVGPSGPARKAQRHVSPALVSDSEDEEDDERDVLPSVKLDFAATAKAAPDSP
ncbi:hypothetical protein HDZ31DRAFT_67273 [Schizophyllum fasciatum]